MKIHTTCLQFLKRAKLELRYRKGYKQTPETTQLAEAQLDLTRRVIAPEQW